MAAIMKDHKVGGLNNRDLSPATPVQGARSPHLGCGQGWFPLESVWENPSQHSRVACSHGLLWLLAASLSPFTPPHGLSPEQGTS